MTNYSYAAYYPQVKAAVQDAIYVCSNQVSDDETGTDYVCSTAQRVFVVDAACTLSVDFGGESNETIVVTDNMIPLLPGIVWPEFTEFTVTSDSGTVYVNTMGETRATITEAA